MKTRCILLLMSLLVCSTSYSTVNNNQLEKKHSLLIKEYLSILDYIGDDIWKKFSEVPKPIILVTDDYEYLMFHPYPSNDFKNIGVDDVLNTEIFQRKRTYNKNVLASFPAVNGVVCIVIGTPENTNKNVTDWLLTLVHERFHQYQMSQPDYFKNVEALDLSNGDETGMWMLNYPFPYGNKKVIKTYNKFKDALLNTIENINSKDFTKHFAKYKMARHKLKKILSTKEYRYFSLQLWQEGLARHNEFVYGNFLKNYEVSNEVKKMKGFVPFEKYTLQQKKKEVQNLSQLKLDEHKRLVFYSLGFGEGLLLDKANPDWRNHYLKEPFYLEDYYEM